MIRFRDAATDATLWLALVAGLALPALFNVGYGPIDLEIGIVLAVLAVLALAASRLPNRISCLVLGAILALTIHIYYFPRLNLSTGILLLTTSVVVSLYSSRTLLIAGAAAGIAASGFAAFSGTRLWLTQGEWPQSAGRGPAVIHLVLDEYAAPGAMPREIFTSAVIEEASDWYVRRGFTTFERSYSEYGLTAYALSLLANANRPEIDPKDMIQRVAGSTSWSLTSASAFVEVARQRPIRALITTYFDLRPALATLPHATRAAVHNASAPSPTLSTLRASLRDRLLIMRAIVSSWLLERQQVELYAEWARNTAAGRAFLVSTEALWRLHPAGSVLVLDWLIEVEARRLKRGQYLFAHLILPHYPYLLTAQCKLREAAQWLNRIAPSNQTNTLETRAERYRLYAEQVACTRSKLDLFLAAIDANPELRDAVVLVHGDHGARIAIEERAALAGMGYDEADYLRDWHAAFFAVRLPARQGRLVTTPHAIQDLYVALIKSDFADLPLAELRATPLAARMWLR